VRLAGSAAASRFRGVPTPRLAPLSITLLALVAAACSAGDEGAARPAATTAAFDPATWVAPREADIPADSMGASIRRGLHLLRWTPESLPAYATSNLRCTSCHQDDGIKPSAAPLTGSHIRYPRYLPRAGAVIGLTDRVNYCFTRSLAGNALPADSREMIDILAYLAFLARGIPMGASVPGADGLTQMARLDGDTARGRALFTSKTCVVCHGSDGGGVAPFPALWGPMSYSIGASMSRVERAASFIRHNMPQTAPGTLTDQESFDLAAYVNSMPRPDLPGKELDWPLGGAPIDVPYATPGRDAFHPPALLPRRNPRGALVPNPPSVRNR
jgi:thiosulfate dehydrogenase